MFDVGFWEIVVIFGLGLVVLGPEKLSRIAAQLGRWVGRARRTASQLRYQLEREIDLGDRPRPRYTPPPKTAHIIPPPGKQSATAAQAAPDDAASAESPEAGATTPPADSGVSETGAGRDSGT